MKITFSALGPSIEQQIRDAGFLISDGSAYRLRVLSDLSHQVTRLHIAGLLTDAETHRARKRIMTQLLKLNLVPARPADGEGQ